MMTTGEILQRCNSCGAGLTLEHMRGTECPYCKVVFPHHAQAVGHAALVNQIMAQQMGSQAQLQQQAIAQVFGSAPPGPGYGATPPTYGAPPAVYGLQSPGYVASPANNSLRVMIIIAVVGGAFGLLIAVIVLALVFVF